VKFDTLKKFCREIMQISREFGWSLVVTQQCPGAESNLHLWVTSGLSTSHQMSKKLFITYLFLLLFTIPLLWCSKLFLCLRQIIRELQDWCIACKHINDNPDTCRTSQKPQKLFCVLLLFIHTINPS